jgi:CRP-like cAMP-binding protein
MNPGVLLTNVAKHITLTEKEKKYFISLLRYRTLKRKDLLLQEGEICKYSTFVLDGALKGYTVDKEGNEHILSFALQDWWIADMYSYISQKPGTLNIEAVADSDIAMLSKEDQEMLYAKVPKFERFFRILIENSLVANQQRLIDNLSSTAEDRYIHFIKKYPLIPSCVPQHNIASYLGITPEFLSKIRARLAKRKKVIL